MSMDAPVSLPFSTRPCQCVKRHSPTPTRVELHHVHQQSHQRRLWGTVRDKETVALCDNGHAIVHAFLERMRRGDNPDGRANDYLFTLALQGRVREMVAEGRLPP